MWERICVRVCMRKHLCALDGDWIGGWPPAARHPPRQSPLWAPKRSHAHTKRPQTPACLGRCLPGRAPALSNSSPAHGPRPSRPSAPHCVPAPTSSVATCPSPRPSRLSPCAVNIALMMAAGFFVNGPYALITTAVSADLGTHESLAGGWGLGWCLRGRLGRGAGVDTAGLGGPLLARCACARWRLVLPSTCRRRPHRGHPCSLRLLTRTSLSTASLGNERALATVTAIIDGMGSIGAAIGPMMTGYISGGWLGGAWGAGFLLFVDAAGAASGWALAVAPHCCPPPPRGTAWPPQLHEMQSSPAALTTCSSCCTAPPPPRVRRRWGSCCCVLCRLEWAGVQAPPLPAAGPPMHPHPNPLRPPT